MNESSFIEKETQKYINQFGEVPPHWVLWPKSHPYSIQWRQGSGETYVDVFSKWLEAYLPTQESRIAYFKKHTPPPRWLELVIECLWDLEGWNEPNFDYSLYLEKLRNLGFKGTTEYQSDLKDKKWLE